MSRVAVVQLERQRGLTHIKTEALKHYLGRLTGWAEPLPDRETERVERELLWEQVVESHRTTGVSVVAVARRLDVHPDTLRTLEADGRDEASLKKLREYATHLQE